MAIPSINLTSGNNIPQIGLGTWQIKDREEGIKTIKLALESGYRHIDSAQFYENEQLIGEVIEKSNIPRQDIFITTKISISNLAPDKIDQSFKESLRKLRTNYVDLLLIHYPVTEHRKSAWRKLEEIYNNGQAKSIGVSNYTIRHLEELLKDCRIKPVINQVELHVYLQQPDLVKYCLDHDIAIAAYSPLAHGHGLDNPILENIAKKYSKTPAQIMIRWCIEKGLIPLPKSTHENRIKQNIDIFDFSLSIDDMNQLSKLDEDLRVCWDPTNTP